MQRDVLGLHSVRDIVSIVSVRKLRALLWIAKKLGLEFNQEWKAYWVYPPTTYTPETWKIFMSFTPGLIPERHYGRNEEIAYLQQVLLAATQMLDNTGSPDLHDGPTPGVPAAAGRRHQGRGTPQSAVSV